MTNKHLQFFPVLRIPPPDYGANSRSLSEHSCVETEQNELENEKKMESDWFFLVHHTHTHVYRNEKKREREKREAWTTFPPDKAAWMENTARVVGLVPVGRLISKIVADKASLIRLEKNRIDM